MLLSQLYKIVDNRANPALFTTCIGPPQKGGEGGEGSLCVYFPYSVGSLLSPCLKFFAWRMRATRGQTPKAFPKLDHHDISTASHPPLAVARL